MPPAPRIFAGDEELGKRDDEYKPGTKSPLGIVWQQRRIPITPHRRTVKRLALALIAFIGLYYFFKNMPTDLEPPRPRPHYTHPGEEHPSSRHLASQDTSRSSAIEPDTSTSSQAKGEVAQHTFNGPIKFYELATTLHAASNTKGSELLNHNVLFAAASLKSVSTLLPIACEMALAERSFVHFALMGRDTIELDILKSVNGISKECKIIFHDARPDFSIQSSEYRMEVSVSAGFSHINTYVHPQATLVDSSGDEELFFLKSIKQRAQNLGRTIIDLPADSEQNLMWLTLLDSAALSAWNKINIDIIIHAQPAASGSLMRLLNSLRSADFFSSAPPTLTIELPNEVDGPTKQYLERFKWPPKATANGGSLLNLHHRIPQTGLTPEENSIRFLESFWPVNPFTSHVLVLSPHVELSPLFFHYLKYTILDYGYGVAKTGFYRNFMGISLDLPSTYLNDSTTFIPPYTTNSTGSTPFLWQAPNSNAALYFGDKWTELHNFVSHILVAQHKEPVPPMLSTKVVSKAYPSWLEHILKLMQVRGYWMLYPGSDGTENFATIHNDLYQTPEEYADEVNSEEQSGTTELGADPSKLILPKHNEFPLLKKPLTKVLPFDGDLPKVVEMPLIDWEGDFIDVEEIGYFAEAFSKLFRDEVGSCDGEADEKPRVDGSVSDLFCLSDE